MAGEKADAVGAAADAVVRVEGGSGASAPPVQQAGKVANEVGPVRPPSEFPAWCIKAPPPQEADPYRKRWFAVSKYQVHMEQESEIVRKGRFFGKIALGASLIVGYYVFRIVTSDEGEFMATTNAVHLMKVMPTRAASRVWGSMADTQVPNFLVKGYAWATGCRVDEAEKPIGEYASLQEWFTRRLKPGVREVSKEHQLVVPADCTVFRMGTCHLAKATEWITQVKGFRYELEDLLRYRPKPVAPGKKRVYCVMYLSPSDYHRFHVPASGWAIKTMNHIFGSCLPVHYLAYKFIDELFCINERLTLNGSWEHGFMGCALVGAYNVGSIELAFEKGITTNRKSDDETAHHAIAQRRHRTVDFATPKCPGEKGDELGHFRFGSTVVLVADVPEGWEWLVQVGDKPRVGQGLMGPPPPASA